VARQRYRHADLRGGAVVHAPDRIEVAGHRVAGERLDQHAAAVRLQRLPGVARGAERVGHVVQAVEERDQVEVVPGVVARLGDLEARVGDAGRGGVPARDLDRRRVVVVADEGGAGERTGQQQRARAVPAT